MDTLDIFRIIAPISYFFVATLVLGIDYFIAKHLRKIDDLKRYLRKAAIFLYFFALLLTIFSYILMAKYEERRANKNTEQSSSSNSFQPTASTLG